MYNKEKCPICGADTVPPYGPENSDILLVGEYPGIQELRRGVPFVGEGGDILDQEMSRVGIHIWQCRLTNLWLHVKNDNQACFEEGVKSLTKEMTGRKVLLMGSELAAFFLNDKVTRWSGMEVKSALFPSTQFAMMSVNPALCLHQPMGEFRLAVEKFAIRCKQEK